MRNYQNIIADGVKYGLPQRKESAFFNEGKWEHFIEPLLPAECSNLVFLEFGCNYGLYLKLAQQRGFSTVLGVEGNAELRGVTNKYLGREDQVLHASVDEGILMSPFVADLPATDFVLMANFHYHLYLPVFLHLVDMLRRKTRYLVVVSVENADVRRKQFRAENGIQATRRYFREWTEAGAVFGIPANGDPTPRTSMFSVLFKSRVERVPMRDIPWGKYGRRFYQKVIRDMGDSGDRCPMTHPCLLRQDGSMADGHHRMASQELDGATTLLVEKV